MARAVGLKMMCGCMIESSVGIAAGLALGPLFDWLDLDGNLLLAKDPFTGLKIANGVWSMPEGPGLGVTRPPSASFSPARARRGRSPERVRPRDFRRLWSARAIVFSSVSPSSRAAQPSEKGTMSSRSAGHEALARELGGVGVRAVEEEQELVAAHADRGFLGAGRAHQEARDAVQDGVARVVPELVVVLLEVVEVDHDAAPRPPIGVAAANSLRSSG